MAATAVPGERRTGLSTRALQVAAGLVLASAVVPFWAGHYLPFLDLPQHLGLATVIRHYGDPAYGFARYYQIDVAPLPYWGFYLPVVVLALVMPVSVAAKVVFSLYAVALPLGLADLLGAFGRDRRLALFAVPLVFNANLFMGFTSFIVSLPVWLFALAAAERWLAAPEGDGARRRARWAGALAVAVYLCHGQSFLLLVCAVGLLWLVHGHRLRSLWPFAPAAVFLGFWLVTVVAARPAEITSAQHLATFRRLGVPGHLAWNAPGDALSRMGQYLFDVYPGGVEDGIFLGVFGILLMLVVLRPGRREGRGRFFMEYRLELVTLGILLSYFVSPMQIGEQWYVSPRHLVFAALLAPAFAGPGALAGWRRWLLAPLAGLAVALSVFTATRVHAFQAEVGPLDQVLAAASPRGRSLGLIFDNGGNHPVRMWPLLHFAVYLQVAHGGDVGFSFAGLPSIPVRYRKDMQAPHPYEWRPWEFTWARYGRYYDRILVRGPARGDAARLAAHASRVVRAGPWILYEFSRSVEPSGGDGVQTGG